MAVFYPAQISIVLLRLSAHRYPGFTLGPHLCALLRRAAVSPGIRDAIRLTLLLVLRFVALVVPAEIPGMGDFAWRCRATKPLL
jgi:hypothetical protein